MSRSLDITGRRFGHLTVVCLTSERRRKYKVWLCKCDCGGEITATGASLVASCPRSCGCRSRDKQRLRLQKRPYESLYNSLRKNAVKRWAKFFSYEDFLTFMEVKECHYCGDAVHRAPHRVDTAGNHNLDRKDSSIGYTKDNCVVCCWPCNRMKYTHSYDDFIARAVRIASRRLNG